MCTSSVCIVAPEFGLELLKKRNEMISRLGGSTLVLKRKYILFASTYAMSLVLVLHNRLLFLTVAVVTSFLVPILTLNVAS